MKSFDDPVVAFNAAVDAFAAGDVKRFGECFDPISLDQFKRQSLENLQRERRLETVDEYLRHDRAMPREVAAYHVARMHEGMKPDAMLREQFPSVDSIHQLEAMSPDAYYFAFVDGRSLRRQVNRLVDDGRLPKAALDQVGDRELVAVGSVQDGDRVALVLYRDEIEDSEARRQLIDGFPERERAMMADLVGRGHSHLQLCHRQPDGSWRLVADFSGFGYGGLSVSVAPDAPE